MKSENAKPQIKENSMNMWKLMGEATRNATVRHLLAQNEQDIDCDRLSEVLSETVKAAIPELIEEWKEMLVGDLNERQLQWAVNIQANTLAAKAIVAYRAQSSD